MLAGHCSLRFMNSRRRDIAAETRRQMTRRAPISAGEQRGRQAFHRDPFLRVRARCVTGVLLPVPLQGFDDLWVAIKAPLKESLAYPAEAMVAELHSTHHDRRMEGVIKR